MASFPISTLSSLTQRLILPKIWDNIFPSNPLLARLVKRANFFEATDDIIRFPVMLAQNGNAMSYLAGDLLNTAVQETSTAGELNVAKYNVAISLPGPDLVLNIGKGQIINILKSEVYVAEKSLRDTMGTDLYGTNSTGKGLVGLQVADDDANTYATYAGISRTSNTTWKAQRTDGSSGALSLSALQNLYMNCSIDSAFPTLIVAPMAGVVKLQNLVQPQQRFGSEDIFVIGARNIAFNNAAVIPDPHVASTQMLLLNENYLHLYSNLNRNFVFLPFQPPFNQDLYVANIRWYGQVICEEPRLQGKYENVDFTK